MSYLNAAAEQLTGWTAADAIGLDIDVVVPATDANDDRRASSPSRLADRVARVIARRAGSGARRHAVRDARWSRASTSTSPPRRCATVRSDGHRRRHRPPRHHRAPPGPAVKLDQATSSRGQTELHRVGQTRVRSRELDRRNARVDSTIVQTVTDCGHRTHRRAIRRVLLQRRRQAGREAHPVRVVGRAARSVRELRPSAPHAGLRAHVLRHGDRAQRRHHARRAVRPRWRRTTACPPDICPCAAISPCRCLRDRAKCWADCSLGMPRPACSRIDPSGSPSAPPRGPASPWRTRGCTRPSVRREMRRKRQTGRSRSSSPTCRTSCARRSTPSAAIPI